MHSIYLLSDKPGLRVLQNTKFGRFICTLFFLFFVLNEITIKYIESNKNGEKALSSIVFEKLNSQKTKASELETVYVEEEDVDTELLPYTQLSWEEQCESSSFKEKHHYDYLINEDQIDYIFPANDQDLYELLNSNEFLNNVYFFIFIFMNLLYI